MKDLTNRSFRARLNTPVVHASIAGLTCWLSLLAHPVFAAGSATPKPPIRLEIQPNAIQKNNPTMTVRVAGVPQKKSVRLQVLQDCDRDGRPEMRGTPDCPNPLMEWQSDSADSHGVVFDSLNFQKEGRSLPKNQALWLHATLSPSERGGEVIFGLVENPCSLWQSLVETFFDGRCNPKLAQALRQHRTPLELEDIAFEVGLLQMEPNERSTLSVVPRTQGATGVAWADSKSLLVTVGVPPDPEGETPASSSLRPGLYRVSPGLTPAPLWQSGTKDRRYPSAPLRLSDCRVAFVRQTYGTTGNEPASLLHILENRRLDAGIPLPYKIHQLVAKGPENRFIIALTLGMGENRPGFLKVDLKTGEVTNLGFHRGLYHAAMRSPTADISVISTVNPISEQWYLVLVDGEAEPLDKIGAELGAHQWMPAWGPDGRSIAFLAHRP